MKNSEKKPNPILYPPTVIGHVTKDVSDLFAWKIKDKNKIDLYYGVQLNAWPHMGTTLSLMFAFAVGKYLKSKFSLPTNLTFGALENGPGEKKEVNGIVYQKMLCDTFKGKKSLADINLEPLIYLLNKSKDFSGINYKVVFYHEMQKEPIARRTLIDILEREEEFVHILNPSDDRLRIRFKCPKCGYEEKHAKTLKVEKHISGKKFVLSSKCHEHGRYKVTLKEHNKDFIDVNTLLRNVLKEAVIIHRSKENNALALMVEGSDWHHTATLITDALIKLGYSYKEVPIRIYSPMIEDWSGAKFSKSLYVKEGTYNSIPKQFVNLSSFLDYFGENGLEQLWSEVVSWIKYPKRLYRNYTIDYLECVIKK